MSAHDDKRRQKKNRILPCGTYDKCCMFLDQFRNNRNYNPVEKWTMSYKHFFPDDAVIPDPCR
jgi:hypothetical protein